MDSSQIKKFFQNMKTHFKRNNPKEAEQLEEAEKEDAIFDKKEDPGAQKMNSGEHKQVYGLKRKIVAGVFIFAVLVFALSYAFFKNTGNDAAVQRREPLPQSAQSPSKNQNGASEEGETSEYKKLYDQRKAAQQTPQIQQAQRTTVQPTPGVQQIPPTARQSAPSPAIYPAAAPAAAPAASASSSEASRAAETAKKAADDMEKRFASAIDFALGGASGGGSDEAQTETATGAAPMQQSSSNVLQLAAFSPASASPYVVQAGTMIPAMLFSGINTDTPGQVVAQTTADVYDSLTQSNLLIPAGSRLIGTYEDKGESANGRVNVTFSTIIFPTGESFDIGSSMLAVDGGGYNGIVGKVNRHTSRVVGAGMFSSAIAALGSLASGNTNSSETYTGGQLAMQGAMANLIETTSKLFEKSSNVQPTVTVEPGHLFQLFVVQPISFGGNV